MKKLTRKLNLSKRTISNLNSITMNKYVAGGHTNTGNNCGCGGTGGGTGSCGGSLLGCCPSYYGYTCNGQTCHRKCGY